MGIVDESGKIVTETVEALRSSPALLVLVLLQITTLVTVYLASQANQARQGEQQMAIIERCFPDDVRREGAGKLQDRLR